MRNKTSGIYKIINRENGKFYLGSSKNIENRWTRHLWDLNNNHHHNQGLQRAWNKYGAHNFVLEVISHVNESDLKDAEQKLLDLWKPWETGYNIAKTSDGGDMITGHANIEQIKNKQRENTTNRWQNKSEEEKKNYREKMKGSGNPNWKGGRSCFCPLCHKSMHYKSATCRNCRNRSGTQNPFFGKKHSQETKNIVSQKNSNRDNSKKLLQQKSKAFYASAAGIEHKKALSLKMQGANHPLYQKGHSEATKEKIRNTKAHKKLTIEENVHNFFAHSQIKHFVIIEHENNEWYFLGIKEAARWANISSSALEFRCRSKNSKWEQYKMLNKQEIDTSQHIIIDNIKRRLEQSASLKENNPLI